MVQGEVVLDMPSMTMLLTHNLTRCNTIMFVFLYSLHTLACVNATLLISRCPFQVLFVALSGMREQEKNAN